MYSDLKVWHGEENVATWNVFESRKNNDFAVQMFDHNINYLYVSETKNSENRKIEIIFKDPILFDKLVITKSSTYDRRGFFSNHDLLTKDRSDSDHLNV